MIASDQDIEKKIMKILGPAGIVYGKHLKKWHGEKLNRMRMLLYIYTSSSSLFIHFSRNDMLPAVSVLLVMSLVRQWF